MGDRIRAFVIVIVAVVWAANFIAPLFVRDYQPNPELNVAFMAVIGFATASYGSQLGNRRSQQNTERPEEAEEETPSRRSERGSSGGVEE